MNLHTLRAKISLIFFFALILLITAFGMYYGYQEAQMQKQQNTQYKKVLKDLRDKEVIHLSRTELREFFLNHGLKKIEDYLIINKVKHIDNMRDFSSLSYENNFYFHLHLPFIDMLFLNTRIQGSMDKGILLLVVFILILLFMVYFWILKSLAPLAELQKKVQDFGSGNYEIDASSKGKDEISMLSNEFHYAAKRIHALITSRQLFLRTIMHELKTPIAKGRIVSGLLDDMKQKGRLDKIFTRLDGLINEFSKIEQVVSKNYKLKTKPYKMSELVLASIDMLMLDEEKIEKDVKLVLIEDYRVFVDFDLYTLAIKNLLDNALKYAEDKKVTIQMNSFELRISNKAKALPMSMDEYFKPFHNDVKHQGGLGLGIYIVKSIIDLHEENLNYEYQDSCVAFSIKTC
ncbi:MAG TPA: HAMP domain-containing histidine kinase [Sulfurimonas sp.]|nr:HAMP domain-containing histidine kinase [Sulfurimonas sp.]